MSRRRPGLKAAGWANGVCVGDYNNDGFDDIFCTYFGQNRLYRNNGNGTFTDVTKEAGLWQAGPRAGGPDAPWWTTTATATSISSSPITSASRFEHAPVPGAELHLQLEGRSGQLRAARAAHRAGICFIATMVTEPLPMSPSRRESPPQPRATA